MSESTEPVPNIWPIIAVREVRAVRAMVSNGGALYLPRLKQVKSRSPHIGPPGQVNATSVALLLLHWPLPLPAAGVVGKIRAEPVVLTLQPNHLLCVRASDTCGVSACGRPGLILMHYMCVFYSFLSVRDD